MSFAHLVLLAAIVGTVLWFGRRVPLAGWRRRFVIGCRAAAAVALGSALWGAPARRHHEAPRQLIYLVDRSASIDAAAQAWIAQRIASLETQRPTQMPRALMVFGRTAQTVVPFGRDRLTDPQAIQRAVSQAQVASDHTNLETALLAAAAAMSSGQQGSIVLFSDGHETLGNVTGIFSSLRHFSLEVYPVPTPVGGETTSVWKTLDVPPAVQRGSPIAIQLVVFNASSQTKEGLIGVALQGVSVKRQRIALRPGWQVVRTSVPALGRGTTAINVTLEIPEERLVEQRPAYTEVEGPPQVLLVTDRPNATPALSAALKRRQIDVVMMRPTDLPTAASRLLEHDAVLLFNVPKSSFSPEQAEALRAYVEEFGGGMVMIGLGGELAQEVINPSPIDPILPVQFEPKGVQAAKRRVCMILLIDRSASMLGPRIAATKRAAVELVKQLSPEDLVGILAFDVQPYVVAEVQPAGQVGSWLVEKLVKLRSSGGTDIYPALTAAADRLELTGATLKHIILLSDGNTPFHEKAYRALIDSLKLQGTTVSTIGIGAAFINTDYLQWLAASSGGTFYQMRNLDELPRLIARDTQHELGRLPFSEGYFRPSRTPSSDWFVDTTNWPTLRGYLTTSAKPSARVDLTVNGGGGEDPLLARWLLGQGRVVSFTSDAEERWSPEWIRWPGFEGTWATIVRWAMRTRPTEEMFVSIDETQEPAQLMLEGTLREPQATLSTSQETETLPLSLVQTGSWRWQASLEQVPSGWYQLAIDSSTGGTSTPIAAKRWVRIGTPPATQEIAGQPPDDTLLRQVAQATSGIYDAPDRALVPPTTSAVTMTPLLGWWLPLAMLALLVDVALRGSSML